MRTYTFSEARQKFAEVLDAARTENVVIQRRGGESFLLTAQKSATSPFDDVPIVDKARVTTKDIVEAVRFSRAQPWRDKPQKQKKKKK